jgi:hypothetical protein
MKRLWRVELHYGDLVHPDETVHPLVANCAICRNLLKRWCHHDDPYGNTHRRTFMAVKDVWLLLLMAQKHGLFGRLDVGLIAKIFGYYLEPVFVETLCSNIILECNHTFHRHCFETLGT